MPPFGPLGLGETPAALPQASGGGFAFGPYLLDTRSMQLLKGTQLIPLSARQLTVLHALLASAGKVLSKNHLIEIGWKQAVSDSSLEKLVSELRKALDPGDPFRYIKTVSGHGYQFIAPVTRVRPVVDLDALIAPDRIWGEGLAALESLNRNDLLAARQKLEGLVAAYPDQARFHIVLALTCALLYESTRADPEPDQDTLHRAEAEAYEACRLEPGLAESSATLGFVLERSGDRTGALSAARRATRLDPFNWRHQCRLAMVSWGEESLGAVRQTLRLNPGLAIAHFLGARVCVARGAHDEVARLVRTGVQAMEAEVQTSAQYSAVGLHLLDGLLCFSQGRYADALAALDRETALEARGHVYGRESCANAWSAKAVCCLFLADPASTYEAFGKALERISHHPMALAGLAIARWKAGAAPLPDPDVLLTDAPSLLFEREMAKAVLLSHAGNLAGTVRLLETALAAAPPGGSGWLIPLDPMLRVWTKPDVYAPVLDRLRHRAR